MVQINHREERIAIRLSENPIVRLNFLAENIGTNTNIHIYAAQQTIICISNNKNFGMTMF